MEVTVHVNLVGNQYERETKLPLVAVSAENASEFPTGKLELMFEYDYDPPQAGVQDGGQQHGETIPANDKKRHLIFDAVPQGNDGPLEPGETRAYVLHRKWMQTLEGIVASLPPERYRLVISNNGEWMPSISGPVFADYVHRLLRFIEGGEKGRLRFRQKKLDCTLYLYRPSQGESLESTEPIVGVIQLVEVLLSIHPFWFGIIELPFRDDDLFRTFTDYSCDLVLEDGRQGAAVVVRAFAKEDYMAICVSGRSILAVHKPQ
jgi:hypothetical protein